MDGITDYRSFPKRRNKMIFLKTISYTVRMNMMGITPYRPLQKRRNKLNFLGTMRPWKGQIWLTFETKKERGTLTMNP
jgi:hypothetical protein